MEYIKPEIKFKKFYTESFLAEDILSGSSDSDGDLEHDFTGNGDSFFGFDSSSGNDGWFNL